MAVLGKRKAPEPTISDEDAQEIFRRHFEARFNPLAAEQSRQHKTQNDDSGEDDNDDDDDDDDDDGSNADNSDAEETNSERQKRQP
ncbi:hypothetical protein ESCO_003097 [Escovopsis weberi]|uniref:Uncharacterized protein n=1 Tax=Escovopsis weberi TaxID=150374 RepID=A0A0M8MT44_ESCWE|nr:hypothetical protein ESCO_003097 [Escovopsis weberi]